MCSHMHDRTLMYVLRCMLTLTLTLSTSPRIAFTPLPSLLPRRTILVDKKIVSSTNDEASYVL